MKDLPIAGSLTSLPAGKTNLFPQPERGARRKIKSFIIFAAWDATKNSRSSFTYWLFVKFIHRLCERKIFFRHAAGVMRRQHDIHAVVDVEPLRMMIHFFGHKCYACHKTKRCV